MVGIKSEVLSLNSILNKRAKDLVKGTDVVIKRVSLSQPERLRGGHMLSHSQVQLARSTCAVVDRS